jgi:hypothetical protein
MFGAAHGLGRGGMCRPRSMACRQILVGARLFAKPVVASAVRSLPDMIEAGVTLRVSETIASSLDTIRRLRNGVQLHRAACRIEIRTE